MSEYDWIDDVKSRGLSGVVHILLDVLTPVGPLGAQLLWAVQPIGSVLGLQGAIRDLANALETSEGIEHLHQLLEDEQDD